jgi:hypothetical protein
MPNPRRLPLPTPNTFEVIEQVGDYHIARNGITGKIVRVEPKEREMLGRFVYNKPREDRQQ